MLPHHVICPAFEIDLPKLYITPDAHNIKMSLEAAGIAYKCITDGYITFSGKAFGADIPLMFGIHYNTLKVKYIEVFRPIAYYQSGCYDISASFKELSAMLKNRYGAPIITMSASIGGYPCEQWATSQYIVNHYVTDRFGFEEHLRISFYK